MSQRTYVYIDGFNLYYGCLKNTPYKWLNVEALVKFYVPDAEILKIKYFTALVSPRPGHLDVHIHQNVYMRALKTLGPKLEIHLGHYLNSVTSMRRADAPIGVNPFVKVLKTEEKGSDVNLASHLLVDAAKNRFDLAVVISNDSDLLAPVRMSKQEFGKRVGVLNPHRNPAKVLLKAADFFKPIRTGVLQLSQFPAVMEDTKGSFYKPEDW